MAVFSETGSYDGSLIARAPIECCACADAEVALCVFETRRLSPCLAWGGDCGGKAFPWTDEMEMGRPVLAAFRAAVPGYLGWFGGKTKKPGRTTDLGLGLYGMGRLALAAFGAAVPVWGLVPRPGFARPLLRISGLVDTRWVDWRWLPLGLPFRYGGLFRDRA